MYHPVVDKIKSILNANKLWYESFEHAPVKTSIEAAQVRTGYTLAQGAKALIVRVKKNGEKYFVMLVLPGDKRFDKDRAKKVLESNDIRFATEEEIGTITDGVKIGGIPPFGNLFNLKVFADPSVLRNEKIIFNAGDRGFSIAMKAHDYENLVDPIISELI